MRVKMKIGEALQKPQVGREGIQEESRERVTRRVSRHVQRSGHELALIRKRSGKCILGIEEKGLQD